MHEFDRLHSGAELCRTIWKLEQLLGAHKAWMRTLEERLRELNQCHLCYQQEATEPSALGPVCGDCEARIGRQRRMRRVS